MQRSWENRQQNRNPNPVMCSQVLNGDNQSQRDCGKLRRGIAKGAMSDISEGAASNCWQDFVQGNMLKSSRSCRNLQRNMEIQLQITRLDHHNLQVTDCKYVDNIFTNLRRKLGRSENDEMFDLKTNVQSGDWMSTTMKSAAHLGREYQPNLIACRNSNFEEIKTLFDITLRLITPEGKWDQQANQMIDQFQRIGHPICRGTCALDRGVLKRKSWRNTIHFTADSRTLN